VKREDFIFTIGYERDTAIVDGRARRKFGRYSTKNLAEEGLFKAALSSALFAGSEEELQLVLKLYNEKSEAKVSSVEHMKRIFGVSAVPDGITKTMVI
jgi:hypothetical protein